MTRNVFLLSTLAILGWSQEAESGFELRTTLTAAGAYSTRLSDAPRSGSPIAAGGRGVLYPSWKLSSNWSVSGAVQIYSRPYFSEQFTTQGQGVKADVLQVHLDYSRFWKNRSLVVRVGQLSSAFGSFLLRYDDATNPLTDLPQSYGYYYKPVTSLGMAGAQVDFTSGKLDARVQLVNSSPANRRGLRDRDQYGNWSGGLGYTIFQGLRVGASAYRGPYLHRQHLYYFPGEAKPRDLPASAIGIDAQWARGAWTAQGELHWFTRTYKAIPNFTQQAQYLEARRVLHPRWYLAARLGHLKSSVGPARSAFETAVGFRPNAHQLIKVGVQKDTVMVQFVTTLRLISIARD